MNAKAQAMTESVYRKLALEAYDRIEAQFEDIDPDAVECEVAQGALTLTLPDGARWVLAGAAGARQGTECSGGGPGRFAALVNPPWRADHDVRVS